MPASSVHITYPIDGAVYPIIDPHPILNSAYFAASFSAAKSGGPYSVKWWFDNQKPLGKANFYDQFSGQFTYKLPKGKHVFYVSTDFGSAKSRFEIK